MWLWKMVRLFLVVLIRIYELTISKFCCIITFLTEEWLYKLFMHQACVFENKYQYDMSNMILSNVISDAFTKGHIKQPLKDAIEAFQIKLNNKQRYLAFYIRKQIHNCYDAMTTSPCESMNSHIKNSSKATTLNNTRWVLCWLRLCMYQLLYMVSYITYQLRYMVSYIWPTYSFYEFVYMASFKSSRYLVIQNYQSFSTVDYWWYRWSYICYWHMCQTRVTTINYKFKTSMQEFIPSQMCFYATWAVWQQE